MRTSPPAAIEVSGLSKAYGSQHPVTGVSFAVRPGSVTGFLGPNGAGKSTTLRMLVGLTRASAGRAAQLSALLQGLAFGMLLRASAVAIAAFYVLPNVWSVLFSLTASLKHVAPWVDLNQAQGALYNNQITGTGWLQLLAASSIWILLPLVAGAVRALRGEITSA